MARAIHEVDHVYTWVNSDDTDLRAERHRLSKDTVHNDFAYRAGSARFLDNGELKASIARSIKFLPFVRNIIVFGSGVAPEWLSEFSNRVSYIPQATVVPRPVWPNFQSSVIEAYIHLIPGLSEHYIYSNDDLFVSQPHQLSDFFTDTGKPKIVLSRFATADGPTPIYRNTEENSLRALKRNIRVPRFKTDFPSLAHGLRIRGRYKLLKDLVRFRQRGLPMLNSLAHVTQPYIKSMWPGFLRKFSVDMQPMFAQRFRSSDGLKTNFMYLTYLRSLGLAESGIFNDFVVIDRSDGADVWERQLREIMNPERNISRFCLNDTPVVGEDNWSEFVHRASAVEG